jgi:hypothetical protein
MIRIAQPDKPKETLLEPLHSFVALKFGWVQRDCGIVETPVKR